MKSRLQTKAKWAVLSGLAIFCGSQLLWTFMMEFVDPRFCDPQFGIKFHCLRTRLAESPDRPLFLMLGSSRVNNGFRPELLPVMRGADGREPLPFNFGLSAGDIFRQLQTLRRLLAAGITPKWAGIEIPGPVLASDESPFTRLGELVARSRWDDLDLLFRHSKDAASSRRAWWISRVAPAFGCRNLLASDEVCAAAPTDRLGWRNTNFKWVSPADYKQRVERVRLEYGPQFEHFRIADEPDRALHELLDLCRANRICAFLLTMPEPEDFQNFYPPGARATINRYLGDIAASYGLPFFDATNWVAGAQFFPDAHHLGPPGAERFTARFNQEIFQPLLRSTRDDFAASEF